VLRRLRIENLVLIRDAELELAPGLNAITGETGAGKTILAQAIGLLLGAKADAGFIGPDGTEAYVEAELELPAALLEDDALAPLAELRPDDEDGLVLARRIFADGRTRAYAWGRSAAREDVAAAAERAIAMSGQFEQRRLARPSYQLEVLDGFIGDAQRRRRAAAREAWRGLLSARRRHDELQSGSVAAEAHLAELRALVADTDGMESQDEERLLSERERLRHMADLVDAAATAAVAVVPDDGEGVVAEPGHQLGDVARDRALRVRRVVRLLGRVGRLAVAAQVRTDDGELLGEQRRDLGGHPLPTTHSRQHQGLGLAGKVLQPVRVEVVGPAPGLREPTLGQGHPGALRSC
jgi:DNA repair protein RecN (Recombination protein N)